MRVICCLSYETCGAARLAHVLCVSLQFVTPLAAVVGSKQLALWIAVKGKSRADILTFSDYPVLLGNAGAGRYRVTILIRLRSLLHMSIELRSTF